MKKKFFKCLFHSIAKQILYSSFFAEQFFCRFLGLIFLINIDTQYACVSWYCENIFGEIVGYGQSTKILHLKKGNKEKTHATLLKNSNSKLTLCVSTESRAITPGKYTEDFISLNTGGHKLTILGSASAAVIPCTSPSSCLS